MAADGHLNFDTKINTSGFKKGTAKLGDQLGTLKSQLKGIAAAAAAAFSIKQISGWAKECKEGYLVQLEAESRLEQVLRNTTGATQEQIQSVKDWASELQKVGVIGDEITMSGLQELGTYIENADSLKTMAGVLDDMLAQQYGLNATAESAVTISTMLGKVLEGQTSALSRYGYSFTEAQEQLLKFGTEEQRVATLAEVVEASVGGMNEALARTPAGQLQQVKNDIGDVKELFGQTITNIEAMFLPALRNLTASLSAVAAKAVEVSQALAAAFGVELDNTSAVTSGISAGVEAQEELTAAVEETGKAQEGTLAAFDQLNTISAGADSGSTEPAGTAAVSAVIDPEQAEKEVKKLPERLERLIEPVKLAWDANSPELISKAQRAAESLRGLFGSVGDSLDEVWTNGSGERLVGNILIGFTDVLTVIGDVGDALRAAWDDGGAGTALVQSYFDRWNSLLELIHAVSEAASTAWNAGAGQEIFSNILAIITNINDIWTNLRTSFTEAWTENDRGVRIFSGLFGIINSILGVGRKLTDSVAGWALDVDFGPLLDSLGELLEAVKPFTDNVGDGLLWLLDNVLEPFASWTIEDAVPAFLDLLSSAIGVLNTVLETLKPLGQWLWDNFLSPIASFTGGVIVSVLEGLASVLDRISKWVNEHQTILTVLGGILGSLAIAFTALQGAIIAFNTVVTISSALASGLIGIGKALTAVFAALTSPVGLATLAITALIAAGVLLIKHWDEVKAFAIGVWEEIEQNLWSFFDGVVEIFTGVKDFLAAIWEGIKLVWNVAADWFKSLFVNAWNNIKGAWSSVRNWFTDLWNGIKAVFSVVGSWFRDRFREAWVNITGIFSAIGGWFSDRWSDITRVFSVVGSWFSDKFRNAWENIKAAFSPTSIASFFGSVWSAITGVFSHITDWFKDKFSKAWQAVKDVFSRGGAIFEGITDSIASVFIGVVNSLIDGINWVIAQPFEGINWALDGIRDVEIAGWYPFDWLPTLDIPEIPHLAQGTVVPANYGEFLAVLGDNRREQEVVSPISTMKKALLEALAESGGMGPKEIVLYTYLYPNSSYFNREVIKVVNNDKNRRGG